MKNNNYLTMVIAYYLSKFNDSAYKALNFGTLIKYYIEGYKSSRRNIFGIFLLKKVKHHYFFNATKL